MPERINGGQLLVVLGAVTLLISLFLNWYEPGRSAWTVFEVWDVVLAAIAVAALGAAIPLRGRADDPYFVPRDWLPALAAAALVIVVVALVNHPPAARDAGSEAGAWLALAAAIVLAAGAILSRARVSLVISLRSSHPPRPTPAPPEPPDAPVESETATQTLPDQS